MRLLPALDLTSGLVGLDVRLDARVLLFATLLTLGTGFLFGLVPALRATSAGVAGSERRTSGRGGAGTPAMRQSLVVAQVALALVLLVGAGLTIRTLRNLESVPLGFDARNLVLVPVDLAWTERPAPENLRIYESLSERVRTIPGVSGATLAWFAPFSGRRMANDIFWESGDSAGGRERINVDMNVVDVAYFQTLAIPLLSGRPFSEDDRAGAPDVAVVNQALAARLWPGENAVGKRIWEWRGDQPDRALEVVGVVANGRYHPYWRTGDRPFLFVPLAQNPSRDMTLHVRGSGGGFALGDSLRRAIAETDATIPAPRILTAESALATSVSLQRTNARLLALFGALATVVAMIGVYGVVSFTVSQRTHEIGVRMALGARPLDVRRMILLGSARPILAGSVLGLIVAGMLTRFLAPLLFGVSPLDPVTFGLVALGVVMVGLFATHVPARRATRIDPLLVMRD
jgi:predicted permease